MKAHRWLAVGLALTLWGCGSPSGGSGLDGGASTSSSASSLSSATGGSSGSQGSAGSAGSVGSAGSTGSNASSGSSGAASAGSTSGTTGSIQRGPTAISFDGDPEGLWWDAPSSTLYVADQENNQISTWTDAAGLQTYAVLPGGVQGAEDLGQVILLPGGPVVVTVFGFGTNGAIDIAYPDGGSTAVAGLDPTFRRLGLTQDSNGNLYDSYFIKESQGGGYAGTVAQLTLTNDNGAWSGTETSMVTGLGKPVGVLAVNGTLYITDQQNGDFLSVTEASLPNATPTVVASNLSVDLISAGPGGVFFTGSTTGVLNEIDMSGNETAFASGYHQPRGSAYDSTNNRIFFGDHIQSGGANDLVIVPGP